MRQADYLRSYAAILDMCAGTNVDPLACIRTNAQKKTTVAIPHPWDEKTKFTFALGLVEGMPVFSGDAVWHSDDGWIVLTVNVPKGLKFSECTWEIPEPPMFELGGKKFPCASKKRSAMYGLCATPQSPLMTLCWNSPSDRDEIQNMLIALITGKEKA